MAWTTDSLVTAVKRKAFAPSTRWPFTDQQVLDIAWEEMMKRVVPAVRSIRENYWTTTLNTALAVDSLGAYPTFVRVPTRASASTATSVWIVRTNGDLQRLTRVSAVERMSLDALTPSGQGGPNVYALEGDKLYLYPPINQAGLVLRVQYDRRPSLLVPVSSAGLITVVAASAITAPGGTFAASPTIDVVQANPPCDILLDSIASTYLANVFTLATNATVGKGIAVGDYVCPYGYTCVLPLPDVLHMALIDLTVATIKSEQRDEARAQSIRADVESYMPALLQTLAVRVSADPPLVFNRESPLRSGRSGWGRW
jgi:hypothetical protein